MFNDQLKKLRKQKKLSQAEFAKEISVAQSTVGNWESGKRDPDFRTLKKIASYFGVSTDFLLDGSLESSAPKEKCLTTAEHPIVSVQDGENVNVLKTRLLEIRTNAGYSQKEVAEKLGVSPQAYSHYENGIRTPDIFTAQRIAKIFNTTVDSLVNEEKARQGESPNGPEAVNLSAAVDNLTEAQKQAFALFLKELKEP